MAFCQFCGKEVNEGEACGCAVEREVMGEPDQEVPAPEVTETPVQTQKTPVEVSEPAPAAEPVFTAYEPDETDDGAIVEKPKDTKVIIAFAAAAAVIVIAAIIILIVAAGGGYKKPVTDMVKAFNEGDGKILTDVIATEKMLKYFEKEDDMDYDDVCDQMEDMIDEVIEEWEEEYGDDPKISVKFGDKDKLDEDDIDEIEDIYKEEAEVKVKIEKAYELECEITIAGEDDDDEDDYDIVVFKVKDEGWKLYIYNEFLDNYF